AAGYPAREPRVLGNHCGRGCPRRINALIGDRCDALPTIFVPWNSDWIAVGFARPGDIVEPTIAKAHNDLTNGVFWAEAHKLTATISHNAAATPVPQQLRRH